MQVSRENRFPDRGREREEIMALYSRPKSRENRFPDRGRERHSVYFQFGGNGVEKIDSPIGDENCIQ